GIVLDDPQFHPLLLLLRRWNENRRRYQTSTTSPSDSSPSLVPFETSDSLLEEFAVELALLDPFPSGNEDDNFDPEDDLRDIE
nr:hypothetical protein [Tanacetum cinerariifolium]